MVAYYGMSEEVGTLSYYDSTGQSDMALTKPYSEQTAQRIDAEARRLLDEAYAMAERVLREHAAGVEELAELLLAREVVFTEDVERIFGKRKKDLARERSEAAAASATAAARKEASQAGSDAAEDAARAASVAAEATAPEDVSHGAAAWNMPEEGPDSAAGADSRPDTDPRKG